MLHRQLDDPSGVIDTEAARWHQQRVGTPVGRRREGAREVVGRPRRHQPHLLPQDLGRRLEIRQPPSYK